MFHTHRGIGRRGVVVRVGLALALGSTLAGCSLGWTDRRARSLLQDTTERLDGGAITPTRDYAPTADYRAEGYRDETPESRNPAAYEMLFNPADADRDVAAKLDRYAELPEEGLTVDLPTAWRLAQESAREYLTAEEEYILAGIRLLIERHRFSPRFFNDLSASVDGSFNTTDADTAVRIVNELRVSKQLEYGGSVEARLIWDAAETLRENVAGEYESATQLVLNADIPLLRGAGPIAKESLIQAERDLVYAARDFERFRREFLVDIARDYFGLVAQQAQIANQERSYESLLESQRRTQARVDAGRVAAFETRRFENDVLRTRNALINAREAYLLSLDRFKVRLGLSPDVNLLIVETNVEIPEPEILPADASLLALEYRLDLQTTRDRVDDARRGVVNSRNQLLPDLDLAAGLNIDTNPNEAISNFDFDFKNADYNASVTFGLPLDRRIERLNLRNSMISAERSRRGYEQARDNVLVEARRAVRVIDQARFNLGLAERQVEINELILEQLRLEEASSLDITDAEEDLLAAADNRDTAVRNLRIAILDYLLSTGTMRVTREGLFQSLPGMGEIVMETVLPPTP